LVKKFFEKLIMTLQHQDLILFKIRLYNLNCSEKLLSAHSFPFIGTALADYYIYSLIQFASSTA